jgi:hypothetical protein
MARSKQEQDAFAKGLIPYVVLEGVCLLAGVAIAAVTGQMFWILIAALVGGAPLMLFLVRYTNKSGKR